MANATPLRPVCPVQHATNFLTEPWSSLSDEPAPGPPNEQSPDEERPDEERPDEERPGASPLNGGGPFGPSTGATASGATGTDAGSGGPPSSRSGRDPRREAVFCPVLGALLQNGQLQPDEAGRVRLTNAARAMASAGVSIPFRSALAWTSPMANKPQDIWRNATKLSFDLFSLRGGLVALLAGKGDSGILNSGIFDEAKFSTFVSHSQDGTTMTIADFARATRDNALRDGRRSANVWARANLAAIIIALGYDDAAGRRCVDIQALRDLYEHKRLSFPEGAPPTTGLRGVFRVLKAMARLTPRT